MRYQGRLTNIENHVTSWMVNIVENWGEITAEVEAIRSDSVLPGYSTIAVKLLSKRPYGDFPLLIHPDPANKLEFLVNQEDMQAQHLAPGDTIDALIRAGIQQRYFAKEDSIKKIG
jgi:hypothetical protein